MNEGKSSKKQILLIVSSAILLLTCVVTGIYALYKSGGSESASATAAKWGVTVTAAGDGSTTFKSSYDGGTDASVVSSADPQELLAAPGTAGSTVFSITGKPETAVKVEWTLNDSNGLSMIKGPAEAGAETKAYTYYPVKWTLKQASSEPANWSTVSAVTGCDGVNLAAINTYLTGTSVSKSLAANTDLTSVYGYYQLSWSWPASQSQDAEDTYIGNVAAGTTEDSSVCTKEAFKLKISVTQLDTYTVSEN